MARLLPRSTRWRVALFAALASALVLGLGSYWFVQALRGGLESSARTPASDKVNAVLALLDSGVAPADVPQRLDKGGGYMISPDMMNRCSAGLPDVPFHSRGRRRWRRRRPRKRTWRPRGTCAPPRRTRSCCSTVSRKPQR
jgi:hypothetical protein